jgi:hypothetical protein
MSFRSDVKTENLSKLQIAYTLISKFHHPQHRLIHISPGNIKCGHDDDPSATRALLCEVRIYNNSALQFLLYVEFWRENLISACDRMLTDT